MNKKIFIASLIVPGLGHLLIKRYKEALFGFIFFSLSIATLVTLVIPVLSQFSVKQNDGIKTIGALAGQDDSFKILLGSALAIFIIIALLLIDFVIADNASKKAIQIANNEVILSFKNKVQDVAKDIIPHVISVPLYILVVIFTLTPALISILIAFTNYTDKIVPPAKLIQWVQFENFAKLVYDPSISQAFRSTTVWTIVWTFSATTGTIVIGVFLAVLLHQKTIPDLVKKIFRSIFLLPWAIPAFLTLLVFAIFFSKIGTMNTIIMPLLTGKEYSVSTAIPFLIDPQLAKITIIGIQWWLGFPYIFILVTGVLQSIPEDLYESANLDGASALRKFMDITFPIILISCLTPFIMQFLFQFNNMMIFIYLGGSVVKEVGSLYSPVETIASLGFKLIEQQKYSTAAVFSLVMSVITSAITMLVWIKTGAFNKEEVM